MKKWLKCDLHIHTSEDKKDKDDGTNISFSAIDLINVMSKDNFDVLAISLHDRIFFNKKIEAYAKQKGILLIPSIEKTIEGGHVIFLNISSPLKNIRKLEDVLLLPKKVIVLIPHPFYPFAHSIGKRLVEITHRLDAIEIHSQYFWFSKIFNHRAKKAAKRENKTLVGNSDAHIPQQLGRTYSLIYAEKNALSIGKAIRNNKVKGITKPLRFFKSIKEFIQTKF